MRAIGPKSKKVLAEIGELEVRRDLVAQRYAAEHENPYLEVLRIVGRKILSFAT